MTDCNSLQRAITSKILGQQGRLLQRAIAGDVAVVARVHHDTVSGAAQQINLGADDRVLASRLLVPVVDYKDAKALHV